MKQITPGTTIETPTSKVTIKSITIELSDDNITINHNQEITELELYNYLKRNKLL